MELGRLDIATIRSRKLSCVLIAVLFSAVLFAEEPGVSVPRRTKITATKSWSVRWQPMRVVNGTPVLFRVMAPAPLESLSGKWMEHEVFFNLDTANKTWYGFAGSSLQVRPGSYPLELKATTISGKGITFERKITIQAAKYPRIAIQVAKQYTEPNPEQLKKVSHDTSVKQEVFHKVSPEQEWSGKFQAPVDARISDVFGTQRTINGKVQSTHQGLDYAVPSGTPVAAVNTGTVLLARPLYFEGNCVVLDHGQGLLTLYMHLSEIKVKEGEKIERGEEIGLSGGSGRATGPHLHLAVRWQGIYLNPATLLRLNLPKLEAASDRQLR
jgi:murein DD-endopeptidase MepM/ murein hydrolase activator NlpD